MTAAAARVEHAVPGRRAGVAGWFVIALSAGTALLPTVDLRHGALVIGTLLLFAGAAEIIAGTARRETRGLSILAGSITMLAGLLFSTDPATKFLPTLTIVMSWLFLRSMVLAMACLWLRGSVQRWTGLSALTDFILALILAIGLSISTLIVALFGATPPLIASFAWILAVSFVATGLYLLEVASCQRDTEN